MSDASARDPEPVAEAPQTFRFDQGVTLAGGGPHGGALAAALAHAPRLVCADGGANAIGDRMPDAVIGDCDSLENPAAWRARLGPKLVEVAEQESTDLEKCLMRVAAPFFLGVGFLGGRLDHELAALSALLADPRPIALIGAEDLAVAPRGALRLALAPGDRVSIFPLAPVKTVSGFGLSWPVDGLSLAPGGRLGVSNRAAPEGDGRIGVDFDGPGAIVCVPRARLGAVVAALGAM